MAATDQLHREENPCQRGAVHTWHIYDVCRCICSGRGPLLMTHSGPEERIAVARAIGPRSNCDRHAPALLTLASAAGGSFAMEAMCEWSQTFR